MPNPVGCGVGLKFDIFLAQGTLSSSILSMKKKFVHEGSLAGLLTLFPTLTETFCSTAVNMDM